MIQALGPSAEGSPDQDDNSDFGGEVRLVTASRERMLHYDLAAHGVTDERVVAAMRAVQRERFVDPELVEVAYDDRPLPIGSGQTISQPAMVAIMAQAARVEPTDRVLEIGTGSGYGAAVLAELGAEVWTVERHQGLAESAAGRLAAEGYPQVTVVVGDGTLGWPGCGPFDVIVVTASGPEVPPALVNQLATGGRLIMPVGPEEGTQTLIRVTIGNRDPDAHSDLPLVQTEALGGVRFVPLIGDQGWHPTPD